VLAIILLEVIEMSETKVRRVDPDQLEADRKSAKAALELTDYHSQKPAYAAPSVQTTLDALQPLLDAEDSAKRAYETARDNAVAGEWALHNVVLGIKQQVVSQYGDDSNEAQAVGLKKKSERKTPARKPKA
jgi:hypothetical protein